MDGGLINSYDSGTKVRTTTNAGGSFVGSIEF
jgi:hypothetical protein